ncbi:unnamed protein product [Lymnaea stagnalis]|uniref:CUB domain-containing protein n=1 Tax=Lymnaea stagnalis TaxID=6523 RepID=A0AAV2I1Y4_LYMST
MGSNRIPSLLLTFISILSVNAAFSCESHIVRSQKGVLSSPSFPNTYPYDYCIQWIIKVGKGWKITIRFLHLDIPATNDFCYDSLYIGFINKQSYCGSTDHEEFPQFEAISDHISNFNITFNSTSKGPKGAGFNISYEIENCFIVPENPLGIFATTYTRTPWYDSDVAKSNCNLVVIDSSGSITITPAVQHALMNRHSFSWLVSSRRPDSTFYIMFKECTFNTDDYLKIFDGQSESSDILGSYNGDYCPNFLYTKNNAFLIKFVIQDSLSAARNFTIHFRTYSVALISEMTKTTVPAPTYPSPEYLPNTRMTFLPQQDDCPVGYLSCGYNEKTCYPKSSRCDGFWNCPLHGADEKECSNLCAPDEFSCNISSRYCYKEADRCNGKGTCTNYIDEIGCTPEQCSVEKGLFLCNNGRCIYEKWRCDRTSDCTDNSDEDDCSSLSSPRVIVAAVVGSLICSLLLVVALGCVCKVYNMRIQSLRGLPRHETPLSRQLAEMFHHRAPPPPYHEAMLTSRPFDEAYLELLTQNDENQSVQLNAGPGSDTPNISLQPGGVSQRGHSNRCRRSRRHREINQNHRDRSESQGLIDIGTLPALTEMLEVVPRPQETSNCFPGLSEPPRYSELEPLSRHDSILLTEPLADSDGESIESDNWHPGRRDACDGNSQTSFDGESLIQLGVSSTSPIGDSTLSTGAPLRGFLSVTDSEGIHDVIDKDPETAGSGLSVDSANGTEGGGNKHCEEQMSVMDEDSDSDCILAGEDEEGDNDDDTDSDTACLLRHT